MITDGTSHERWINELNTYAKKKKEGELCRYSEFLDNPGKVRCNIAYCSSQFSDNGNNYCGKQDNVKKVLEKKFLDSDLAN